VIFIAFVVVVAIAAPVLAPYDPVHTTSDTLAARRGGRSRRLTVAERRSEPDERAERAGHRHDLAERCEGERDAEALRVGEGLED